MFNKILIAVLGLSAAGCGQQVKSSSTQEAWNRTNDPLNLNGEYSRTLADLPLEANLQKTPWSDTYWPSTSAGLANRWKDSEADSFKAKLKTKAQVKKLTEKELAMLSPAEKFDIFNSDYKYTLTKSERARTSPDAEGWEGLCHGWAPAAILFDEPKSILLENNDGIKVPFGSSDIKGLLTFLQGEYSNARTKFLGARCNIDLSEDPDAAKRPECRDTNAGAFHIVITNQIGIKNESFVADVTRDLQVWNQPVHGFTSKVVSYQEPSEGAAPGTVKEAIIETSMKYTVEVSAEWNALLGTEGHSNSTVDYEYRVELNADGEIIGGEWISDERPDFLWIQNKAKFSGLFKSLKTIYDSSIAAGNAYPDPTAN
jgi:hypothetical protein